MSESSPEVVLVVLPGSEPTAVLAVFRQKYPDITVKYHSAQPPSGGTVKVDSQVPSELWKDVTILVTIFHLPSSLSEAPKLKLVHLACSGVNHIVSTPAYQNPAIAVTTASGCASPQIAEWVMMTALTSSWDFPYLHQKQQEKRWLRTSDNSRDAHNVRNLVGQRMGILGYGSIGRQIARLAKAFGMEVFAYTATPKETLEARRDDGYVVRGTGDAEGVMPSKWFSGVNRESLHRFLDQDLDMLVLCVPSTTKTASLIGAQEFDILTKCGRKPFLTNVSRGTAVDQDILINMLKSGKLQGAALDVQDPEPLPPDHPLWDAPNVTISPHMSAGGVTDIYMGRVFEVLSLNIACMKADQPLLNAVNRSVGY